MQVRITKSLQFIRFSIVVLSTTILLGSCSTHGGTGKQGKLDNPFAAAEGVSFNAATLKASNAAFRLAFIGSVNGEIDTCGCAVNPKGGLDRQLNFVRMMDQVLPKSPGPVLLVDAGNALFPNESIPESHKKQQFEKARLILKAHNKIGIHYQNVGHLDLSAGLAFLKDEAAKNKMTLISANLADAKGQLMFAPSAEVDIGGGVKVTLIGLSRGLDKEGGEYQALEPLAALKAALSRVKAGQPVVLLSDLGMSHDRDVLSKIDYPMIAIGARDLNSLETPEFLGSSVFMQAQMQGQQWGIFDVATKAGAKRWYDISSANRFSALWNARNQRIAEMGKEKESGSDVRQEVLQIEDSRDELMPYAPKDLDKKNLVDYRGVEMTVAFAKVNELTPLMAAIKKTK